jgi:CO/xanthine dehydrogenase FAD-binding subunit
MPATAYHAPESVAHAVALLAGDAGARPLAGGTDLIVQMRSGRNAPSAIVDLKRIAGMIGVRALAGGGFAIGAATPCSALKDDAALAAAWPGVVEAANLIGSVQVRNRATMAGNLCNASPAADSVPALVAAGATCLVAGPNGEREVPVEAISTAPGRTSLAPGEFIVEIRLPAPRGADAYLRSIPRTEMDIAVVGAGASLALDASGICTAARIAVGAVAPTVLLVEDAGAALVGTPCDDAALEKMADEVRAVCRPIADKRGTVEYRTAMAGVLARRVVKIALERARAGEATRS